MVRRRLALAVAVAGVAAIAPRARAGDPACPPAASAAAPAPASRAGGGLPELSRVTRGVLPAVVGVLTESRAPRRAPAADALRDFAERFASAGGPTRGIASGFVIGPEGWVVTNAHVVEGAGRVEVELEPDERLPARVVGADAATDVALLKVEAGRPLAALPLGDSDELEIAEWVLAVGNPFGLSHSVSVGIVSQLDRGDVGTAEEGLHDFIQTDASINPGSSGGPLVNLRGEVVGIATAINATGQGIGFAVPVNLARRVVRQLREHGRMAPSWLGVSVREGRARPGGDREVVVTGVDEPGPASAGGLRPGDVITAFEGRRVSTAARLRWLVATAGVGEAVALTVRRERVERALRLRLAAPPAAAATPAAALARLPRSAPSGK